MHTRPRRWRLTAAAFAIPLLSVFVLAGCTSVRILSADELVAKYRDHRVQFERLAALAPPDGRFGIEMDEYGAKGSSLGQKDADRYASTLKAIGASSLSVADGEIEVGLGSEGMVSSGVESGYLHTSVQPSETVSLSVARDPGDRELWYYALGDGWYAYVWRW